MWWFNVQGLWLFFHTLNKKERRRRRKLCHISFPSCIIIFLHFKAWCLPLMIPWDVWWQLWRMQACWTTPLSFSPPTMVDPPMDMMATLPATGPSGNFDAQPVARAIVPTDNFGFDGCWPVEQHHYCFHHRQWQTHQWIWQQCRLQLAPM